MSSNANKSEAMLRMQRKMTLNDDDVFLKIFMQSQEEEEEVRAKTQMKNPKDDEDTSSLESKDPNERLDRPTNLPVVDQWKTKKYWNLPENVRAAIDLSEMKRQHSQFWYKLQEVNDKIYVFREMFYSKQTRFEKQYYSHKEKEKQK